MSSPNNEKLQETDSEVEKLRLSCRLCLAPEQDVLLWSPYQNSILYGEVVNQLTDAPIISNDCLPQKICMECASKLVLFYKFRKKIETSQITLTSILLQNDSESLKLEDGEFLEELEIAEQNPQTESSSKEEFSDAEERSEFYGNFIDADEVIEETYTEIASEQGSPPEYVATQDIATETIVVTKKKVRKQTEHQCEECGRIFTRKSVLEQHKNTHSGVKNFNCQICHSWFTRRSHLLIHMRIHENSKPYICEICSRGFRKSGDLARHRRIHFSDRNYPCTMCEKRFKRATDVTSHMRVHTKDKPYRCKQPTCDKVYTSHSSLRKHEMRKHNEFHPSSMIVANEDLEIYEINDEIQA